MISNYAAWFPGPSLMRRITLPNTQKQIVVSATIPTTTVMKFRSDVFGRSSLVALIENVTKAAITPTSKPPSANQSVTVFVGDFLISDSDGNFGD